MATQARKPPQPFTPTQERVAKPVIKAMSHFNTWIYRISGGRFGGTWPRGGPILLLTTVGRKSGARRTTPLVYLRDQSRFPLSLGLFASQLENFGDWTLIMAGNVLMTLPVIVIFFLFQRYFVQGMTMSGMKA